MADDAYWYHIIPQSRYRKRVDAGDDRPIPMDLESWKECTKSDKQALSARVEALSDLIANELMADQVNEYNASAIVKALKRKLGL